MHDTHHLILTTFILFMMLPVTGWWHYGHAALGLSSYQPQLMSDDIGHSVVLNITVNGTPYEYSSDSSTELMNSLAPYLMRNQSIAEMTQSMDGMIAHIDTSNVAVWQPGRWNCSVRLAAFNQTTYMDLVVEFVGWRLDNGTICADDIQSYMTVYDNLECTHIDILKATIDAAHNHSLELIDWFTLRPHPGYPLLLPANYSTTHKVWNHIRSDIAGQYYYYKAPSLTAETPDEPLWIVDASFKYDYIGGDPWQVDFYFTLDGALLMIQIPAITASTTTSTTTVPVTTSSTMSDTTPDSTGVAMGIGLTLAGASVVVVALVVLVRTRRRGL